MMSCWGFILVFSKKIFIFLKCVLLKDGNLLGGVYKQFFGDIWEGDIFYKIIKFYFLIFDFFDDVIVNVVRVLCEI